MSGRIREGLRRILPGRRVVDAAAGRVHLAGPEVVSLGDTATSEVTFSWQETDVEAVVDVHLAGYVVPGVQRGLRLRRADDGRHSVTIVLPDDACVSYGYRVSPPPEHPPLEGTPPGRTEVGHLESGDARLLDELRADPTNDAVVRGPYSSAGARSILELPRARRHPAFVEADRCDAKPADHEVLETYRSGRSVTVVRGDDDGAIVVVLDGDPWTETGYGFLSAWGCWTPPAGGAKPTLALVSIRDREVLTDRRGMRSLLVDDVLPVLEEDASTARGVVVAGHSYGALAAAGLLIDVPHVVVAAICQSGAYWHDEVSERQDRPGTLTQEIAATQRALATAARRTVVIQAGSTERELLGMSEAFARACRWAGLSTVFDVFSGGRDHAWFRHGLLFGLDRILADGEL